MPNRSSSFVKSRCEGKERFETRELANRIAKSVRKRKEGCSVNTYYCANCGSWHIGQPAARQRRMLSENTRNWHWRQELERMAEA